MGTGRAGEAGIMIILTEHFSLAELIDSDTAVRLTLSITVADDEARLRR